jgi:hypothetical protein
MYKQTWPQDGSPLGSLWPGHRATAWRVFDKKTITTNRAGGTRIPAVESARQAASVGIRLTSLAVEPSMPLWPFSRARYGSDCILRDEAENRIISNNVHSTESNISQAKSI